MAITREQAIKDIISTAACLELELNAQIYDRSKKAGFGRKRYCDFVSSAVESLKSLGVTEEEIENAKI